ncbi:SDR family NAD(P)-dependent oxidoreductase [Nonomuraea sp. NPDC059194]|uniref:type I polyketide synthase n=1 Tax=Nonomuraea sp. NPDC059194 TaxID=3346764 RepID=UPI0036B9B56B
MDDPIAIVGASCRYPDADDVDQLWELVMSGRRAFRPIPKVRLNLDDYSSEVAGEADGTYAKFAAVLEGWSFDRARFRVPGSVYRVTDTTHWLALEVAADALTAAGYPEGRGLERDRVGVVIGNTMNGEFSRAGGLRLRWPYVRRVLQQALSDEGWDLDQQARFVAGFERAFKSPFPEPNDETLAGGLSNTIAGRICNHFDFHGGGYTVDGACSSSLLAVITAAKALRAGEVDVAIAGGVDLSLDPFELVGFARTGALATTDMRIYDANPTGFWPGEGCGMVVLMRGQDALAAGRTPLTLISGWGVSSDGRGGITRPEKNGQLLAVRRAYEHTGFGPESVALFEGHGTGTAVGDPVEIATLIEAQGGRRTAGPAALGSIKANIGHTKAAAGVAGLLKATMALHRQVIPPTTGCAKPHESLHGGGVPLRVVHTAETWPGGMPLRAGVSAMGFGGINTHVVLEGAAPRRRPRFTAKERRLASGPLDAEVFAFAADTREELLALLEQAQEVAARISFAEQVDLAASLAESSAGGIRAFRAGIVASSPTQLARRATQAARLLADREDGAFLTAPGIAIGIGAAGSLGLVFTGQGAPVPAGPGALGVVLPGLDDLFAGGTPVTEPVDTAVVQPAIVKASLAGLRWLQWLGVVAGGVVGHSLGEITALHWAGALGVQQAMELAAARGRLMGQHGAPHTGMLSVAADQDLTLRLIDGTELVIAADHGHAHVVAGPTVDIDRVMRRCEERDIRARRLKVSHGFHSPAFRSAEPILEQYLQRVAFEPPVRPVYSTITGERLDEKADLPGLLTAQLTAPVLFRQAVAALAEASDLLVEIGPGHTLAPLAGELSGVPALSLDVGSPSSAALSQIAAALHALGVAGDLRPLFSTRFHRDFDLRRDPRFLESPCEQAPSSTPLPAVVSPSTVATEISADPNLDPAEVVRDLVALALELPPDAISDDDRLLSDLHLNSLRVVQLTAQAATACGRTVPIEPLVLADVSLAELAEYVAALPPAGEDDGDGPNIAGVGPWHRLLLPSRKPADLSDERVGVTWRVWGSGPLRAELAPRLDTDDRQPDAELVFLPEDPSDEDIITLVDAARTAVAEGRPLVVVDHGDTATGFVATIRQEHAGQVARWIGASSAKAAEAVNRILHLPMDRHPELVVDDDGTAHTRVYAPLAPPLEGELPLGPHDLVLISGGGKGIGFQTALALGRLTAGRLALLGRSKPEEDDDLRANLDALTAAGVRHTYVSADVTDPASARQAIDAVIAAHGPVTALIHSSGINVPRRFLDLGPSDYLGHAAPKHHGLREILAALDTEQLRLLVTYGSVIGRFGLPGEAHYALANGRLRELARVLARDLPDCQVRNIDWTAWSGAGMGERLDVLDSLLRSGVVPVPVDKGVDLLRQLLSSSVQDSTVVASGRLPHLQVEADTSAGTYVQRIRTLVPGVELIAEADLDLERHTYLVDHTIDGLAILPAVCAMEAMAEAAAMVSGRAISGLVDCRFDRPVIIPDDGSRTVRICALVSESGEIEVVVRSDESGYAVDHFSARVDLEPSPPVVDVVEGQRLPLPAHDGQDLYGPTFFHGRLFQRLRRYEHLEATACVAVLDGGRRWSLGGRLVLGDPTLNDATIHALQACVPNRRLLPIGCDAFTASTGTAAPDELVLSAVERARQGVEHVYDVSVRDSRGAAVMSWQGLRLRDIGPLEPGSWPPVLLGAYLQRSIEALLPASPVHVHVAPKTGGRTGSRKGRPDQAAGRSHLDVWVLEVGGPAALACDWEWVDLKGAGVPQTPAMSGQREQIATLTAEPESHTLARLWTVRECLSKRGQAIAQAPLTVQGVFEQGWVLLRSGTTQIASAVIRVDGTTRPIAVSVMVKGGS